MSSGFQRYTDGQTAAAVLAGQLWAEGGGLAFAAPTNMSSVLTCCSFLLPPCYLPLGCHSFPCRCWLSPVLELLMIVFLESCLSLHLYLLLSGVVLRCWLSHSLAIFSRAWAEAVQPGHVRARAVVGGKATEGHSTQPRLLPALSCCLSFPTSWQKWVQPLA